MYKRDAKLSKKEQSSTEASGGQSALKDKRNSKVFKKTQIKMKKVAKNMNWQWAEMSQRFIPEA